MNVYIRENKLGRGLFAAHFLQAAECIGEVTGQVIPEGQTDINHEYYFDLEDGTVLDPAPPFRYLNHSCEPNVAIVLDTPETGGEGCDRPRVYLETLRSIQPGEELATDYAWAADGAIPCFCGAPRCRGWIVAREEMHLIAPD